MALNTIELLRKKRDEINSNQTGRRLVVMDQTESGDRPEGVFEVRARRLSGLPDGSGAVFEIMSIRSTGMGETPDMPKNEKPPIVRPDVFQVPS